MAEPLNLNSRSKRDAKPRRRAWHQRGASKRKPALEYLEERVCLSGAYDYHLIGETGQAGLVSILQGASINDLGNVAFVASNSDGQSIYFGNGASDPGIISFPAPSATRTYGQELQLNNSNHVGAVDIVSGATAQRRARVWDATSPGSNTIIARSSIPPTDATFFDSLGNFVSVDNSDTLAFAGLNSSVWEIHLNDTLTEPFDLSTTVATVSSSTFFRQMAADNGQVLLGWRTSAFKRVTLFDVSGAATSIASTLAGWNDLGVRPGISDDGRAVTFYGQDANGPGIFFALNGTGGPVVARIAGVSGNGVLDPLESWNDANSDGVVEPGEDSGPFSKFNIDDRVAVNHSFGATGMDIYTVSFLATDPGNTLGLYTVQVDAHNTTNIRSFQPLNVIGVGSEIPDVGGIVTGIAVSDPVNNIGDVAFVATTDAGNQAVVRANLLDTDQDGIYDAWETNGIDINGDGILELDLPSLGADPMRKDLFVEVDAMSGLGPLPATPLTTPTGVPTSLLTGTALDGVIGAFYHSPVQNPTSQQPTGPDGISLHVLIDETSLPSALWGSIDTSDWPAEFDALKQSHFGTASERSGSNSDEVLLAKRLVYRYAIFADSFQATINGQVTRGISGIAELPGNDFIITLGQWSNVTAEDQAGTFMHEMGHTLGLRHGGGGTDALGSGDDIRYKPNYQSVMNYTWQTPYRFVPNSNPTSEEVAYQNSWGLDYSSGTLNSLNESALDENAGIGGSAGVYVPIANGQGQFVLVPEGGPVDFDGDGSIDTSVVAVDINYKDGAGNSPNQLLDDHDDWDDLIYNFRNSKDFNDGAHLTADSDEVTIEFVTDLSTTIHDSMTAGNDAPVLNAVGDKTIDEGSLLAFTATATDADAGQTLTFSLDTGAPDGASIDPVTGVFTWTPSDGPTTASITVRVTDDGTPNLGASETFTVTVNNVLPTVAAGADLSLPLGGTLNRSGSFTDPGADTWTATVNYGDGSGDQPLTLNPDKTFALAHAYSAVGNFSVTISVKDKDNGQGTASFDVSVIAPPTLSQSVIDDGSAQRSMVRSLHFTFSSVVTLDAGAFVLTLPAGAHPVNLNVSSSTSGGVTVADITFAGVGIIGGSLEDGRYTITVVPALVHDTLGQTLSGANALGFFRLFGDIKGTGLVDNQDISYFRQAYNSHLGNANYFAAFDFNGDGAIDGADLAEIMKRRNKRV